MTKSISHNALDAAFAYIADRSDLLVLCEEAPVNYTAASTMKSSGGARLGAILLDHGLGLGDFSVAPGASTGRRMVVAQQGGVAIAESGTADHIAILDTNGSELLLVTSLTASTAVVAGGSAVIESFSDEIADPV